MNDIAWLTQEAQRLHQYFGSIFYVMVTALLAVGIFVEYFKFPLGQMPSFAVMLGRAIVAVLLFTSYREVANYIADISDALTQGIGGFDNLDGVLKKMGEKIDGYSVDWLSARSMVMTVVSVLTYMFLFYSVVIAEAAQTFTWILLYVFSPILIALFVIPATSGATKALYRSLIEVSCWKVVWATIAALLWSSVLVEINSGTSIDLVKMVCINLMLGGSLLATPWIVHALATSGLAGFTRSFSGVVTAAGIMTPMKGVSKLRSMKNSASNVYRGGQNMVQKSAKASEKVSQAVGDKIRTIRYTQKFGPLKPNVGEKKGNLRTTPTMQQPTKAPPGKTPITQRSTARAPISKVPKQPLQKSAKSPARPPKKS